MDFLHSNINKKVSLDFPRRYVFEISRIIQACFCGVQMKATWRWEYNINSKVTEQNNTTWN